MQHQEKLNPPTLKSPRKAGATAWKIKIENEDLYLLKWIAERLGEQDGGLAPKPTVTALLHKAIKNYIEEAFVMLSKRPRRKVAQAGSGRLGPFLLSAEPADEPRGRGDTSKPH